MCRLLLLILVNTVISGFEVSGIGSREAEKESGDYYFPEFEQISTFLQPLVQQVENEKCKQQLEVFFKSLKNSSLWAVQMLDASGKIPQGFLTSDAYNLGNYDGCTDINLKRDDSDNIYGKYCLATLKMARKNNLSSYQHYSDILMEPEVSTWDKLLIPVFKYGFINNLFRTGICIPNKCTAQDVEDILLLLYNNTTKLNMEGAIISVQENACSTKEVKVTTLSNILHRIIFGLFFGVTAVTIFDLLGWLKNSFVSSLKFPLLMSAYQNFSYLTSTNAFHLQVLDSLRVYTIVLYVVIRRLSLLFSGPLINRKVSDQVYSEESKENFYNLSNSIMADTFLFLSGFLAHYKVSIYFKKNPKLTITKVYIVEYLKSIPLQIFAVLYYIYAFETIGNGPMWKEKIETPVRNCERNWMFNLLSLNNLISTGEICIFESWCYAVIAHCFLIVPIVVQKSSTTSLTLLGFSTVISIILPFYNSGVFATPGNEPRSKQWYQVINITTKDRGFAYLCGIWTSLAYLKIRDKKWKLSKKQVKIFSTTAVIFSILTFYEKLFFYVIQPTTFTLFLTETARKLFWNFSIFWIVIGVSTNNLPTLSPFFIRDHFTPLARLHYPYLLIVGLVQLYTTGTMRTLDYLSIPRLVWMSSADLLSTTVFAFVFYMMIHKPFATFLNEKILKIPKRSSNKLEKKTAKKLKKF